MASTEGRAHLGSLVQEHVHGVVALPTDAADISDGPAAHAGVARAPGCHKRLRDQLQTGALLRLARAQGLQQLLGHPTCPAAAPGGLVSLPAASVRQRNDPA